MRVGGMKFKMKNTHMSAVSDSGVRINIIMMKNIKVVEYYIDNAHFAIWYYLIYFSYRTSIRGSYTCISGFARQIFSARSKLSLIENMHL